MTTVIKIENLWKEYRLGVIGHGTLTADLQSWWAKMRGKEDPNSMVPILKGQKQQIEGDRFWALRGIDLEVKQGEILGIIGKNGAGKSTLLKILSRVTAPTRGHIKVRGRLASLLEVGTGFHPELTGRENIFMNGSILGMSKHEIKTKFDEIVDFSGVEDFIETPVKRYSSGMYVRLAFAVAAHLEPEIMIVDEVLAVGDAEFQKKCLGKMEAVSQEGRTILFVSHNMNAISKICNTSILLKNGSVAEQGLTDEIIKNYLYAAKTNNKQIVWSKLDDAPGNDKIKLRSVQLTQEGRVGSDIDISKEINIEIEYCNFKQDSYITSSIHLLDQGGTPILASANWHSANLVRDDWFGKPHLIGQYKTICKIPGNFLNEGSYSINVVILTDVKNIEINLQEVLTFTVHDSGEMRKEYDGGWLGSIRPKLAWNTEFLNKEIN